MEFKIRQLQLPGDYEAIAGLLNTYWSEPVDAARLEEDDTKMFVTGHTYKDENGQLAGYDRLRLVAEQEDGSLAGYLWIWRAPWTEAGTLNHTLVVEPGRRGSGIGKALYAEATGWARQLGADLLKTEVWDHDESSLRFANNLGYTLERHLYQSVLTLDNSADDPLFGAEVPGRLEGEGIRFTTLADEGVEAGEARLYELYKETLPDIPGHTGGVPELSEWRKWHLMVSGYAPEQVIIAAAGERYVGVSNVVYAGETNGMYHEYTGVSRDFRGRGVGLALKVQAIKMAKARKASYIRTDNDSTNAPILSINRKLGYVPQSGTYRMAAVLPR